MTAFGMGGKKTGSSGVLEFLGDQIFGQILLVVTGVGLLGYTFYRLYQAIKDSDNDGNDSKGVLKRIGYAGSGIFYGFLAYSALNAVIGFGGSSGSGGSGSGGGQETIVAMLLNQSFGRILVGLLAVIFLGKAIFQFYKVYSGQYVKKVQSAGLDHRAKNLVMKAGKIGYTARGVVIAIVAFLTFRAALTADSSKAGGTEDAFQFLQDSFGTIVLVVIALGLLAYGVFLFIRARYGKMALS